MEEPSDLRTEVAAVLAAICRQLIDAKVLDEATLITDLYDACAPLVLEAGPDGVVLAARLIARLRQPPARTSQ